MKRIAIYGSTGSIGEQALQVIEEQGNYEVITLCCKGSDIDKFEAQIRKHKPKYAGVIDLEKAAILRKKVKDTDTIIFSGEDDSINACTIKEVNIVLNSAVGISGLKPTIEFIKAKKDVALANKESLVTGGELVMKLAEEYGVKIIPVDSEHSAIWQLLVGNPNNKIERIVITASGGPFRTEDLATFDEITVAQALKHPTWAMGKRITIDSATLMNKGFEVIEALRLFPVKLSDIEVVIQKDSYMHAAVYFEDGVMLPHMGVPDMKQPIQYALNYPNRPKNTTKRLELRGLNLEFEKEVDEKRYPCLSLAYKAYEIGGTATAVLNGADEEAVKLFLENKIKFTSIAKMVEHPLSIHQPLQHPKLDDILEADKWARNQVRAMYQRKEFSNLLRNVEQTKVSLPQKQRSAL